MIVGKPKHFHRKAKFQLELGDMGTMSFQSCSELKVEHTKIEYKEGGMVIPYKEPGSVSFSDLTIERAVTSDKRLYEWFVSTTNAAAHKGLYSDAYKLDGALVQYDRDNETLRTWELHGMWPLSFSGGAWDNNSDEFVMEQVVLCYDYFVLGENVETHGQSAIGMISKAAKAIIG